MMKTKANYMENYVKVLNISLKTENKINNT